MAVLLGSSPLWAVYLTLFLLGSAETLADNAAGALLVGVVPKQHLGKANARLFATFSVGNQLGGPPIGAFLFAIGAGGPAGARHRHLPGRRRSRLADRRPTGLLWTVWGLLMASLLHIPAGLVVPGLILATMVFASADVLHAATSNALAAAAAPESGRGKYLSYWQYSFTLAGVFVPAFFAQLFDRRPEYPWLAIAILATGAAATIVVLERVLPDAAVRRT